MAEQFVDHSGEVAVTVGFEGFAWHVQPEMLEFCAGNSAEVGALHLVRAAASDRMIVVTRTAPGSRSVEIAGSLEIEIDAPFLDERLSFRLWSGPAVSVNHLIEGTVAYLPLR